MIVLILRPCLVFAGEGKLQKSWWGTSRLKPVVLQLSWTHNFQFAGYYMAKEKGYYQEAGFDVELRERSNDVSSVESVVFGRADFGVSHGQLNGKPIVVLASILQNSPAVIVALARSDIQALEDLSGKRVMNGSEEIGYEYRAMLAARGVATDQIELVPHTGTLDALIEGRVDACMAYMTDEPYDLQTRKIPFVAFRPEDYGIDSFSEILFTSRRKAVSEPERVKAFRDASLRGWHYAMAHVDETIDLILRIYTPDADREKLAYEADIMLSLMQKELIEIGYVNPARWKSMMGRLGTMPDDPIGPMTESEIEAMLFQYTAEAASRKSIRKLTSVVVVALCGVGFLFVLALILQRIIGSKSSELVATNRRLEIENKRLNELEALLLLQRDFSLKMSEVLTLEVCLNVTLDTLLRIFPVDCGGIYLKNETTGRLELVAHRGVGDAFAKVFAAYPNDFSLSNGALACQDTVLSREMLRVMRDEVTISEGLRALAIIPVIANSEVVATLNIASHEVEKFPPSTAIVVESLANRMGGVLGRLKIDQWAKTRIGQDLHDSIGQQLVGMTYLVEALRRNLKSAHSEYAGATEQILDVCRTVHSQLRIIVQGLLPLAPNESLVGGLKRLCKHTIARLDVACELVDTNGSQVVDPMVANHLYCIAQEAVANAVRHGGAKKIFITLDVMGAGGILRIDDDGCGFKFDETRSIGSGLNIMKCRAGVLGGDCSITERTPRGMSVRCTFEMQPFIEKRKRAVEKEIHDGTTV